MNILDRINTDKQAQVNATLGHIGADQLARGPADQRQPLDFIAALKAPGLKVIAEVKKASPSKGLIRPDFDPLAIAKSYQQHGAACLSILTETDYFQGSIDYLKRVRAEVDLPILRKDFMVDYRQVRESYEMGADAILLILSSLEDPQLIRFYELAQSYGLSVLAEVHDRAELDRALKLGFGLIGVNNRNLKTFETRLETSLELVQAMPSGVVKVSESGISRPEDCRLVKDHGFDAVLVGESLMRQSDPGLALSQLVEGL
ncbi:MAG: indole-3-glycerol phosphate synthase TrpC [bacterium]|nr:indole-3-glycerol phosphate synthase TrpC [bacterium]